MENFTSTLTHFTLTMSMIMKNHHNFWLTLCCFLFTYCGLSSVVNAQDQDPYANQYELIKLAQPVQRKDGKVEVVEFFLYTCPHCHTFEAHLVPWVETKPDYIHFENVPAVFNDEWIPLAKLHYTAEALGKLKEFHAIILKAIHEDKRTLQAVPDFIKLFSEHGVTKEEFEKNYNSFFVDMKVRNAKLMTKSYGITGVPAVVVQGKYRLLSSKTNGYDNLLKVVDGLAEREYQALSKAPPATTTTTSTTTTQSSSVTTETKNTEATESTAPE